MFNLLYTELAEQDLFEIISQDKPTVAVEYITKLEKYIELLQDNPEFGIACKNKNKNKNKNINKDCRILIYDDYLIFYRIFNANKI